MDRNRDAWDFDTHTRKDVRSTNQAVEMAGLLARSGKLAAATKLACSMEHHLCAKRRYAFSFQLTSPCLHKPPFVDFVGGPAGLRK